jgi:hypothetical protein
VKKRKQELDEKRDEEGAKKQKINEKSQEERLKASTIPFWNVPYDKQVSTVFLACNSFRGPIVFSVML